jgi:hypothetical protein
VKYQREPVIGSQSKCLLHPSENVPTTNTTKNDYQQKISFHFGNADFPDSASNGLVVKFNSLSDKGLTLGRF